LLVQGGVDGGLGHLGTAAPFNDLDNTFN